MGGVWFTQTYTLTGSNTTLLTHIYITQSSHTDEQIKITDILYLLTGRIMFKWVKEWQMGWSFTFLGENISRRHRPSLMENFWVRSALSQRPSLLMKCHLHHKPQTPACNQQHAIRECWFCHKQVFYFHKCLPYKIILIRDTKWLRMEKGFRLSSY